MGVYISGMKMPTSCDDCFLPLQYCPYAMKPDGSCPLVPVPPHGRLGDLDALFDFILNIYKTAQGDARKAYRDVLDTIVAAGDVIPAEEGE